MSKLAEPDEEQGEPHAGHAPRDEDRSTRRLLVLLLWFLGLAALGLLVLLVWLLRPTSQPTPPGQAAGYPIEVVTTIYGFGTQPDQMIKTPLGVTFDAGGNIWISDTGQSRVEEYRGDGTFIRTIGSDHGDGQLGSPYGLAVDPSTDRVYVADYAAGLVKVYSTSGNFISHMPADDQNRKVFGADGFTPYDVKIVNGRIVVSSYDGLYFFDQTGHVVARWGGTANGAPAYGPPVGMFNFPDAFTADPKTGNIYVADSMNRRIEALDSNGNWLWFSGKPDSGGQIRGFWQLPRGIQIGPDGNIYVVDTFRPDPKGMGTGHLVVLSPDGRLLSEFGRAGSQDGAFNMPDHLALNADGTLWAIADRENNRVVIFRLNTPYPPPSSLEAPKYKGMLVPTQGLISSTPSPEP